MVLVDVTEGFRNPDKFEHNLPSSDRWSGGENDTNLGIHASGMFNGIQRKLGNVFTFNRVFLQ